MMAAENITDRPDDSYPRKLTRIQHLWIPMADGTRLAASIWMPQDAEVDPVPAILELLPYRKNDGTHLRDSRNAPYLAGHGYAIVRVDIRGTGDSEGVLIDEYSQVELDDGGACLAWMAAQQWCTGSTGIMGISWGGFNGLQIAAQQPPSLGAVLTLCSTDDRYADDVHYFGGQLLADQQLPWATTMLADDARPPDPAVWGEAWLSEWKRRLEATPPFIDTWMSHQRRDGYWKHGSVCEDPSAITCPVMLVGGWADAYRDAILRMLASLQVPRRGIIGPWGHMWPHFAVPGPRIGFLDEAVRWFDRWLKGIENGVDAEPMLISYLQDSAPPQAYYDERAGHWRADETWPSPAVTLVPLRLEGDQSLSLGGEADAKQQGSLSVGSVQAHGATGGRSVSYGAPYDQAIDQRVDDGYALCFESPPLDEPLDILGMPEVELQLSADQPQALVSVRLIDVAVDGASTLVTRGVLNLSHRASHEHTQPLEVGEIVHVRFPLHAIGYQIPVGHRLRVSVAPTLWPMVWPPPTPLRLTLIGGASWVHLPVHHGKTYRPNFGPPQQAAFDHEVLPGSDLGTLTRDLATGTTQVVYASSDGVRLPEQFGALEAFSNERDVFRIADNDPTSASVACERTLTIRRDDWRTTVHASAEMTCSPDVFEVTSSLVAELEDGDVVFQKTWHGTYPRDHV